MAARSPAPKSALKTAPQATPSSSTRGLLFGLAGIFVAGALVWLVVSLLRRDPAKDAAVRAATSATAAAAPARAPVASRPRATISGRVLDPEKQPVVAATVCAWAGETKGLTSAEIRVPHCAVSDAAGAYVLSDLYPATKLSLSASAAKFPPEAYRSPDGNEELTLADGQQLAGVDFVLHAGGVAIRGRVNDATGGVVPGAAVVSEGPTGARATASTDEKGEFGMWVDPGKVTLSATAHGYAPSHANGPAPGHFFQLALMPASTLVGRAIVTGTETPVPDATIEAIQVEGGGSRESAHTDVEGKFRVEGLQPGRYRVEATAEGREGYSGSSVILSIGETSQEQLIPMDAAYVVSGRVLDDHGASCPSGSVTLRDPKQNEFSEGQIQSDGSVRMASVIPGNYKVEVECTGHVSRDDFPVIAITNSNAPAQTWTLESGASVRVAVVDSDGKSVAASSVSAYSTGTAETIGAYSDHPEKDGSYVVVGLKPGTYQVSVTTKEGAQANEEVTVQSAREQQVRIQLQASGGVDGVVEDEDHHPVANVAVSATGVRYATTKSLDDGTFTLSGLPSGDYTVFAGERMARRMPGAAANPPSSARVTVTAPARASAKLTVAKRSASISGRVVDGNGQPVTDAFLDYASAGQGGRNLGRNGTSGHAPVVSDTEGRFTIEDLAEGDYDLRASRKGGSETTVPHVAAGSRNITVRIADGASIAGILTSKKDGAPVDRFTVTVRSAAINFRREDLFFHSGGVFSLHDLPAGTYQVLAESPEGSAWMDVTLTEGEQKKDLALQMTLRGALDGRVVASENGAAVAGVRISLGGASPAAAVLSDGSASMVSGPDGRFHIEGVLGGSWTLTAMPDGPEGTAFQTASLPIQVGDSGGGTNVGDIKLDRVPAPSAAVEAQLGPADLFALGGVAHHPPRHAKIPRVRHSLEVSS